jgi:hypothetical protein
MPRKRDSRCLRRIHLKTGQGDVIFDVDAMGHLLNRPPRRGMAEIEKAALPAPPLTIPSMPAPSSDAVHLTDTFLSVDIDFDTLSNIFEKINIGTLNLPEPSIDGAITDIGGISRGTAWDGNLFDLPWDPERTFRNQSTDQDSNPLSFSL